MSFESSSSHDDSTNRSNNIRNKKLHPDPIRAPPRLTTNNKLTQSHSSKLVGYGPHRSYRHLHHQQGGIIGTFHVRLLEGKNLQRRHWSALSLGPVKHLGLSRAHGEVSSFGSLRLAFWKNEDAVTQVDKHEDDDDSYMMKQPPISSTASHESSVSMTKSIAADAQTAPFSSASSSEFLPNLPPPPPPITATGDGGSSTPLTPFDHQGSLRSSTSTAVRSPFVSYAQKQPTLHQQQEQPAPPPPPPPQQRSTPRIKNFATPPRNPTKQTTHATTITAVGDDTIHHPFPPVVPSNNTTQSSKSRTAEKQKNNSNSIISPHHYAKEVFKSSTVPNDCNPVWGDSSNNSNASNHNSNDNNNQSNFHIPLHKDDLLPTLQTDGGKISLEVRLDEEMAPTESLLVGGALTSAVNVASVATSMVGMGKQTKEVSNLGREMLGLGSDRMLGLGFVDLMPLLVGLWEDDWEDVSSSSSLSDHHYHHSSNEEEDIANLDVYGRIPHSARMMRRRVERMGMLDVWVPLHHPSDAMNATLSEGRKASSAGKVHLLISYEPNGMSPKRDDVVALESFARRPFDQVNNSSGGESGRSNNNNNTNTSSNFGNVISPILPTLSPFLVIDMNGSYLLLEYATSRTVTSVDRLGNIKSSRWERTHRARIHRNSVFVIERRTLLDVAGNIARLPGDIVLSTTVGQEIAEASAPVVAGALELMAPAFQSAKLLMGAGSLGVRASLAGAKAASVAVVSVSQQKAMERREGVYVDEREGSDSGVYRFG
eukprot:CAMPEP_0113378370 /NCGR_PEP_ID=MMETSP0013_2-20120614/3661_1 /TAXON_ID=2843 ORGANISM="Skeletonema costatum, Strain 1716" /NCGR_SAMPLE_ID=MMETSP0013_2 /ASSEMBLY_ACC=CAM_ASM_000158 /LENGTH=766 /DNA_ID=CAMNT_0000260583 /DNA_START=181 /DNA_END=2482 /DNA_ORIENTATION=- /assembly_acc=CAM_ASM_000158